MDIRVRPFGTLDGGSAVAAATESDDPGRACIDLSSARFVDPFGLVTVATVVEACTLSGSTADIKWPKSEDLRRYLSRMHLGEAVTMLGLTCPLPEVNERPLGDRVLELTRFEGADRGSELAEKVYNILSVDDVEDAKTLYQCVSEAVENVAEHSGVSGGWAALQQYRRGGRNDVVFAVADSGVGLRSTLSRTQAVDGDRHAVELAVKIGVSGTGDQARGRGIAGIIDKSRARHGHVRLWSGAATGLTGAAKHFFHVKDAAAYPGTVLSATLSYA